LSTTTSLFISNSYPNHRPEVGIFPFIPMIVFRLKGFPYELPVFPFIYYYPFDSI